MKANRWFIDSETGDLADVLLCPPEYYQWIPSNDIAIQTMAQGGAVDRAALNIQFAELVSTLREADVSCHFLKPQEGMPYQVYTRDSSQTTPFGTVVTRLSRPERVGEETEIRSFYGADEIWKTCTKGNIEGGDIHIIRPGLLAVGVSGGRTDEAGAAEFISWFEEAGWTCRMIRFPEHFLHLDVIFTMVAENLAIAAVDCIADEDLDWFRAQGIRLLPVSYKEAMRDMGCNVLALGRERVVSPHHSTRINQMLRAEGLTVLDPELNQFSRGGGKCALHDHATTSEIASISLKAVSAPLLQKAERGSENLVLRLCAQHDQRLWSVAEACAWENKAWSGLLSVLMGQTNLKAGKKLF